MLSRRDWVFFGGSAGNDAAIDIHISDEQEIIIGGEFWREAQFGDIVLNSEGSTKALFVLSIDQDGFVQEQHVINGTGAKNMAGLEIVEDEIYVSGSFSDTLFIDDTQEVAISTEDIFLLKLDRQGFEPWIQKFGLEGIHTTADLSWDPLNEQFIISGNFVGFTAVAGDTIQTNTFDEDLFVIATSILGEGLWIQKAGGQFEDINLDLCLDPDGNIFLTGWYRGIINFSDGSQINTGGIMNSDAYLIKYSPNGQLLWARTIGDIVGTEFGTGLAFINNQLIWCGYYNEAFEIDGVVFSQPPGIFNGFIATFNPDGSIDDGNSITSSNAALPIGIFPVGNGYTLFGEFSGTIALDQTFDSGANFFGFSTSVQDIIQSTSSELVGQNIVVFPNPFMSEINIELEDSPQDIRIFGVDGRIYYQSKEQKQVHQINLGHLASGIYFWQTGTGETGKVIKK